MSNRALDGAERKGREARRAGVPQVDNPYPDHRTWRGSVTFSRAFRTAWRDGWDAEDRAIAAGLADSETDTTPDTPARR